LERRSGEGRKTLLVTGAERGEGRSLVALALARLAANRNLRTVVVDLDLSQPALAELLGLRPELGWDDACSERLSLAETLIESHDDRLTLLPLRCGLENPRALAGNRFLNDALTELREHFDCIVLDAGPLLDDAATVDLATALGGHALDDGLVIRDRRRTTPQQVHEVGRRLAVLGIQRWDLAENFSEIQGY
jgi:Mrp family chromosome partitioning ATPase